MQTKKHITKVSSKRIQPKKLVIHALLGIIFILTLGFFARNLQASEAQASILTIDTKNVELSGEVSEVRKTRANYFKAIGREDGGNYDAYQEALACNEELEANLKATQDLESEYTRIATQIALREKEDFNRNEIFNFETAVYDLISETFNEENPEWVALTKSKTQLEIIYKQETAKLQNCLSILQAEAKCLAEIEAWQKSEEEFNKIVLEIQNTLRNKQIELEAKIQEMQNEASKEYEEKINPKTSFVEKVGNFLIPVAKAEDGEELTFSQSITNASETITSDEKGLGDSIEAGSNVGKSVVSALVDNPLTKTIGTVVGAGAGLFGGILNTGISVVDKTIGGITGALGISSGGGNTSLSGGNSNTATLNGPGALDGLEAFRANYQGNKHGSAIGMITGWTNFALPFVSVLAIAALVYAGFLYITAAGNQEQTEKAKKIIIWVVIGIIIILSAYAIVNTLISQNSGESSGGSVTTDNFSVSW